MLCLITNDVCPLNSTLHMALTGENIPFLRRCVFACICVRAQNDLSLVNAALTAYVFDSFEISVPKLDDLSIPLLS